MSISIETIEVTPFEQNCRIIYNNQTNKALVIDPGGDIQKINEVLNSKNLIVEAILLTHGHIDHIGATVDLKEQWAAPIYAHRGDEFLISNAEDHGKMFRFKTKSIKNVDHWLTDEEVLSLIDIKIKVLHTPGHSPGSCCFYLERPKKIVIVGDVLFAGSIGRTDLPGGKHQTLIRSIREKLFVLSDKTIVMSGHGPNTTIGVEKETNPFLQPSS